MKVLFVCLGNICRSPMAEAVFRDLAQKRGMDILVDSAGTSGWHIGNPPHEGTLKILHDLNINTDAMHGRGLKESDYGEFDYLIGMDRSNVEAMLNRAPKGTESKVFLFLDVLEDKKNQDVPDPWYTGDFEETKALVLEASNAWLDMIEKIQF